MPTTIVLQGALADRMLTLTRLDVGNATAWFEEVAKEATALGRQDAGLKYYRTLASFVRDAAKRAKKLDPRTKSGTASLPLDDLLLAQDAWLAAVDAYRASLEDAAESLG